MNRTVVSVAIIIVVGCLVGLYIWSSHNRYYILIGAKGIAYEVDRKTGKSWMLFGEQKIPQDGSAESVQRETELPVEDVSKFSGDAIIQSEWEGSTPKLYVKLYNGTDWTVTRVVINVTIREEDGTVQSSREFSESLTMEPLSTVPFSVMLLDDAAGKQFSWAIKRVFGFKE